MKSLKDALTLYRTLAAEGLSEFSYSERGESLGRHLDDLAWRLSRKIRPSPSPAPDYGVWQQVGHLSEDGVDLEALIKRVDSHVADVSRQYLDAMEARLFVGPTSGDVVGALFKPGEDRAARQAQEMHAAIAPALEKLTGDLGGLEWGTPEARTLAGAHEALANMREAFAFPQVTIPKFADFDTDSIEPWQEALQGSVNEMLRRQAAIRRAYESDFLRDVEIETGFRLPLSDPAGSVEDNPTT